MCFASRAFFVAMAIRANNPWTDPEATALIDRFHVDAGQLPIVLCPKGLSCCVIQARPSWHAAWFSKPNRSGPPL